MKCPVRGKCPECKAALKRIVLKPGKDAAEELYAWSCDGCGWVATASQVSKAVNDSLLGPLRLAEELSGEEVARREVVCNADMVQMIWCGRVMGEDGKEKDWLVCPCCPAEAVLRALDQRMVDDRAKWGVSPKSYVGWEFEDGSGPSANSSSPSTFTKLDVRTDL